MYILLFWSKLLILAKRINEIQIMLLRKILVLSLFVSTRLKLIFKSDVCLQLLNFIFNHNKISEVVGMGLYTHVHVYFGIVAKSAFLLLHKPKTEYIKVLN